MISKISSEYGKSTHERAADSQYMKVLHIPSLGAIATMLLEIINTYINDIIIPPAYSIFNACLKICAMTAIFQIMSEKTPMDKTKLLFPSIPSIDRAR
jgi:hypothetical protein